MANKYFTPDKINYLFLEAHIVNMWQAKVFKETDSSSDSVNEEEPPEKKHRPSKKHTLKKPIKQQTQRRKALLKTERQKLENYIKKLNSDRLSMHSFDGVRGQTLFKEEYVHLFCNTVDPNQGRIQGGTGGTFPHTPNPPILGHKQSRYPNRAVSNSNKAVSVFIRQCSLFVKL